MKNDVCKFLMLIAFGLTLSLFSFSAPNAAPVEDCTDTEAFLEALPYTAWIKPIKTEIDSQTSPSVLFAQAEEHNAHHLKQMIRDMHDMPAEDRDAKIQQLKDENPHAAEHLERLDKIRSELKDLPPQKRKARMEELRSEFEAKRRERREDFLSRWDSAPEEQKKMFCDKAKSHCAKGREKACNLAEERCSE